MIITNEIIEAAIKCDRKIENILKLKNAQDNEFLQIQKSLLKLHRDRCLDIFFNSEEIISGISNENIHELSEKNRNSIRVKDFCVQTETINIVFDAASISRIGKDRYVVEPIFFSLKRRLNREERNNITMRCLIAREVPHLQVEKASVFLLNDAKPTSIKIARKVVDVRLIEKLKKIAADGIDQTHAKLISHCKECVFDSTCKKELQERDDLSLLGGLSKNEIRAFQAKGVFTVNQLSHTYRARRRPEVAKPKFYPALKAMAIRESKVYVTQAPILPATTVDVFIDVEALPDIDFYYLIGVVIKNGKQMETHSFWAKDMSEERKIWFELLALLRNTKNYTLHHYGNYERLFFDKMRKRYRLTTEDSEIFDIARKCMMNTVSTIYGKVYFPTYTNGLKDIGTFCGAKWSEKEASGLLSTAWRSAWELYLQEDFKNKIISYNIEDCIALIRVTSFIRKISISENLGSSIEGREINNANDIRSSSTYKWGSNLFLISDLEKINRCAYFDYQSTKIFLGAERKRVPLKKDRVCHTHKAVRTNKTLIVEPSSTCPRCGSDHTKKHKIYFKTIIDLKFTAGGVKRWLTKYGGYYRLCLDCRRNYLSDEYPRRGSSFGSNLQAFVAYLNIALRMSFGEIREYFNSVFGLPLNTTVISKIKQSMARYYEPTTKELMRSIKKGDLLQVDETNARLDGKPCYVWVFATLSEVVYLYADSRKGDILHRHLKKFKGVLVSDFFSAYDSVPCKQQKCLIHLIRDLNDDLFKNQLNEEFKQFIQIFASLIKEIVDTIDKRGLRARYLSRHKKGVSRFFRELKKHEYKTEVTQQYQRRLLKTADRLFTFLDYDNVPWNNNYAENAIKTFAEFRHKFNPYFQKNGLSEYLILLSLQHTCKLRRIDFLQFLLSKRKKLPPQN